MKRKRYADGGRVSGSESKPKPKPKPKPKEPKPESLGSGLAQRAGGALRDRRRQQMEALGLKDGGKVKKKR